jgi:hypothetical protein
MKQREKCSGRGPNRQHRSIVQHKYIYVLLCLSNNKLVER